MHPRSEATLDLARLMFRPVFFTIDVIGLLALGLSEYVKVPQGPTPPSFEWPGMLAAIGSALIAIGISLPVGTFFQLRSNAESFGILHACNRAGIRAIFKSRRDSQTEVFRAIGRAAARSKRVDLLGIALPDLFNPNQIIDGWTKVRDDPRVALRVLLLDPSCRAAETRATVEFQNATQANISRTLDHDIAATIQERWKRVEVDDPTRESWTVDQKIKACNCEFKVYSVEPALFLMMFENAVFTEQYHLGRPDTVHSRGCIGGHVPLIEFSEGAHAVAFLKQHFAHLWNSSKDTTRKLVCDALGLRDDGHIAEPPSLKDVITGAGVGTPTKG
jgi:sarcosine oxidase delta subunit